MGDLGLAAIDAARRTGGTPSSCCATCCARSPHDDDRVTLVPLAPMTNIALLLRTYPDVARGIRRIVFMGGAAHVGNATASAEFNVFHDPEAAAITLDACADLGIEVVMYGLDVFYGPRVTLEQAAALRRDRRRPGRPRRSPDRLPVRAVRRGLRHHRRRRSGLRGRRPRRAHHPAAPGARRARRHLVARSHDRRPARLGRRPRPRPARAGAGRGRRGPRPSTVSATRGSGWTPWPGAPDGTGRRARARSTSTWSPASSVSPRPGETVLGDGLRAAGRRQGRQPGVAAAAAGADGGDGRRGRRRRRGAGLPGAAARRADRRTAASRCWTTSRPGTALITVDDGGENSIVVVPGANGRVGEAALAAVDTTGPDDVLLVQLEIPLDTVAEAGDGRRSAESASCSTLAPYADLPADVVDLADPVVVNEHEAAAARAVRSEARLAGRDARRGRCVVGRPRPARRVGLRGRGGRHDGRRRRLLRGAGRRAGGR